MGIAERRIRERKAVRSLILKASWRIVQKDGWQALSMRKLADAIEYSAPVIYSHFPGKEAILTEFVKQGFQLLNDSLSDRGEHHRDPEAQIEALAEGYLDFGINHRIHYELMYGLGMPSCETVTEIPELRAFTVILQEPITRMLRQAGRPETDALTKMRAFWSMLHGLVSIHLMDFRTEDGSSREILRDLVRNFIGGIRQG
jgi:AcrR family transcriptional regulator